jgi:hypothetical protein
VCRAAVHTAQRLRDCLADAVRPPAQRLPQPAVHERLPTLQLGLLGSGLQHAFQSDSAAAYSVLQKCHRPTDTRAALEQLSQQPLESGNLLNYPLADIVHKPGPGPWRVCSRFPRACLCSKGVLIGKGATPQPFQRALQQRGQPAPAAAAPVGQTWPSGAAETPASCRPLDRMAARQYAEGMAA